MEYNRAGGALRGLSSLLVGLYLSVLEPVGTQCAGLVVSQMSFDVDDIRARSTHPHHIKALSCQVVARDERSFFTL